MNDARTPRWLAFPYDNTAYRFDAVSLPLHWARLHLGDAEALPEDAAVQAAWALFHAGEFELATEAGLNAGAAGITVANKAQWVYASRLERNEKNKQALFLGLVERAEAQVAAEPGNANAHFFAACALGRYSQGISVATALSQGLGSRVKQALETTVRLAPQHADAHIALGAFHAEVIDKVGALLGRTQGASKEAGVRAFKTALRLNPTSAIARVEFANGLLMLEGEQRVHEANRLYEEAAACDPLDAMERLDVEMARAELQD